MNYYIGSCLENAFMVQRLAAKLNSLGWTQTYDWTKHGSAQGNKEISLKQAAVSELQGVKEADIVFILLPGKRGTHAELDAALALNKLVFLYAPRNRDLFMDGRPCSFHSHPCVIRIDNIIESLLADGQAVG